MLEIEIGEIPMFVSRTSASCHCPLRRSRNSPSREQRQCRRGSDRLRSMATEGSLALLVMETVPPSVPAETGLYVTVKFAVCQHSTSSAPSNPKCSLPCRKTPFWKWKRFRYRCLSVSPPESLCRRPQRFRRQLQWATRSDRPSAAEVAVALRSMTTERIGRITGDGNSTTQRTRGTGLVGDRKARWLARRRASGASSIPKR